MRDRLFLFAFFLIAGAVFLLSPVDYLLTKKGLLENQNVGNVIEAEASYGEDAFAAGFLNRAELLKRDLRDVYTNYIPGFLPVVSTAKVLQQDLNRPFDALWTRLGNAAPPASPEAPEEAQAEPEEPAEAPSEPRDDPGAEEPAASPAPAEEAPEPAAPHEDDLIGHAEAIYRGEDDDRYYEIVAGSPAGGDPVDFYVRIPARDPESLRPDMERQAAKLNAMAADGRVQLYVYAATCFEDTVLCDRLIPSESKSQLFRSFQEQLDDRILFGSLHLDTLRERQEKYWNTDHHWNYRGYAEAYGDIVRLLQARYPDIRAREPVFYIYEDVPFYGTNALKLGRLQMADVFGVALYALPEHEVIRDPGVNYGGWEPIETVKDRYDRGAEVHREVGYGHYIEFFRIAKEIRYPENHFGRRLLLICDSYAPPLMEVLASHFDVTYVRYVDHNDRLPRCTLDDYVAGCGVTDVLVLQSSVRIVYDNYGDSLKDLSGLEGG